MESGVKPEANSKDEPKFADELHQRVVEQFEEYVDGTITVRALGLRCRQYRDGQQWTEAERKTLKRRKQPCITDNKIQDKVDTLQGIEKKMRTDPKGLPRNPSVEDEESAEAVTDALRYIADSCQYKTSTRKPAAENLIIEGVCAGQVIVEKKKGRPACVKMEHVRADRSYYDIRSQKDDFSDKGYCGYFTWMDAEDVEDEFPGSADVIESSVAQSSTAGPDSQLDDKPRYVVTSGKRRRVQVFYHWLKIKGTWHECVWVRGGWLRQPKKCLYRDEYGDPLCGMELQALYRDSDGGPYGSVPRYLDLQDEHNKRRSKMLHLLNAKRIKVRKGAVDNIAKFREEAHKADGVLEINGAPEDVAIEDNLREAEGQWRLLQQTDIALSQTGPNAALAGTSGDLSGVAKARDQQAGELPISPLFDALDAWELRMYRQAWLRARQFWTGEMWIRVTDDEKKIRFVGFNQPLTMGDKVAMMARNDAEFRSLPPEEQRAVIMQVAQHPRAQEQAYDDKTGKPMRKNVIGEMDVDVIIDRWPDVATMQQEEFAQLVELAKGRPEVKFSTLVEMSQLRPTTKKKVLEDLKGGNDPAAQQQALFQQMMEKLQALILQAKARREMAAAEKDEAAAQETHVDTAVKVATFTDPQPMAGDPSAAPGARPSGGKASVSVS